MRSKLWFTAVLAVLFAFPAVAHAAGRVIDVKQAGYGAVGDGTTNDRAAIQSALDDVAADGGGTVVIPAGNTFLTGSLRIGSGTTLRVDGTLLQSQDTAHYSPAVERGHDRAVPRAQWDHMWLANQPFLFSSHSRDVTIEGSGTLRMTREPSEEQTIHISPIGFYRVDGFEIRDVTLLDAMGYNVALYSTRHGLVENVTAHVALAGHGSSDGFSIQNSQHLRITRNDIISSDDGIYVWSSYRDPRGTSWWSSDEPQPSKDIEIDHNVVKVSPACCKAVAIIAWGAQAPDVNQVAISDIDVHHNRLEAPEAVGCWCDDVMTPEVGDQAPISRVRFADNEYIGSTSSSMAGARISDLETDFGQSSTMRLQNQAFDLHGLAWWSAVGDPVVEQRPDGDWAARVQGAAGARTAIYQGISLGDRHWGANTVTYRLTAEVAVRGEPLRLFAYETCTGATIAERWVDGARRHPELLEFRASACGNVRIGLDNGGDGGATGTAHLYELDLRSENFAVLATDPTVTTTGSWLVFGAAGDLGGSHLLNHPPEQPATVTIPFHGTRAVFLASKDVNLGEAEMSVDGAVVGRVSFVGPERVDGVEVFNTGPLAPGDHTITMRPLSGYSVFNALLVEDQLVPIEPGAAPAVAGPREWLDRIVTVAPVEGATAEVELFGPEDERIASYPLTGRTRKTAIELPDADGTYAVRVRYRAPSGTVVSAETAVVLDRTVPTPPVDPRPQPQPQPQPRPQPRPAPVRATIAAVRGAQTIGRAGVAKLATVSCPENVVSCRVSVPARVTVKLGGKRYSVAVVAAKTVRGGAKAAVEVRLPRALAAKLAGRRVAIVAKVTASAGGPATTRTVRVTLKGRTR
ncbi:glycosyl hydrolase family 28-related protein [Conexibacter stalactiti]|uniref:Glycosyl hydrolase family 28-related protein n=1 Tax=Conexibacter stalactiti TaxID=1940611 RepID=A0ABU4HHX9_9ACTN|nr:glycosyl hydrolase family 28-related protein [Conexibacter stalactiti]MDW5592908.1 glycosyl hydrolase family 28-related protein [Conexibacter stalactiti]MEC5033549.1 glycosyl hydrolase family 28-related protein [Conexibacter stalactiti]